MTIVQSATEGAALSRDEALRILREHKAELVERFGVRELALFGSTARDEAGPDSDVDILVSYDTHPGWIAYFSLGPYLEDVFGRPVDVMTLKELRDFARPSAEADAIRV